MTDGPKRVPPGCLGALGEMAGELVLTLVGLALLVGVGAGYHASPRATVVGGTGVLALACAGLAFARRSWAWPLRAVSIVVGLALLAISSWLINSGFELPSG